MKFRLIVLFMALFAIPANADAATHHRHHHHRARVAIQRVERHAAVADWYACAHAPALPGAQVIAITGISDRTKCALLWQANGAVRREWHTPPITFVPDNTAGAWPIYTSMANAPDPSQWGEHVYHAMYVHNTTDTATISHELIEELVDPDSTRYEVADPVNGNQWQHYGIALSNFVYPAFFQKGAAGPYDELGMIHHPLDYTYGFACCGDPTS